jgi:hypothetical protein
VTTHAGNSLQKISNLKWGHKARSVIYKTSDLIRRIISALFCPSPLSLPHAHTHTHTHTHKGKVIWETPATWRQPFTRQEENLPQNLNADMLISDFLPPELWENQFLLNKLCYRSSSRLIQWFSLMSLRTKCCDKMDIKNSKTISLESPPFLAWLPLLKLCLFLA